MKPYFNFTITHELRLDYNKFLRGEIKKSTIKDKYEITHYQMEKLFNLMYHEKTEKIAY